MSARIALLTLVLGAILCSCDWNPFGIPDKFRIDMNAALDSETLARIDEINKTLATGINVSPETASLIREINETLRTGIKTGLDERTLSTIDRLLTNIEKGVGIQFGLDDNTRATVNGLIQSIDSMPSRWENSATQIIQTLEGSSARVAATMAKQVRTLMEEARLNTQQVVATTGIEFRCNVDFMGMRAGSSINEFIGRSIIGRLKAIITREKPKSTVPTPWVCGIIPDRVELVRKSGKSVFEKGIITITGYNYVDANLPQVVVMNETGGSLEAIKVQAHRSSPYQLQINLQEIDFGQVPARSRLVLRWPGLEDTSSLAFLVPERLAQLTIKDASVAVLEGPGKTYRILGYASQGAVYSVLGRTGDSAWWQVDYSGKVAWVPTVSVTRNDDVSVPVATEIPVLPPVARFSATPRTGRIGVQVKFEDASEGAPTTWRWEFGDGNTSTARNPVYIYRAAGTYTVRLTVSNSRGDDFLVEENYIIVRPPLPDPNFSANPTKGNAPLEVSFSDRSTGNPTSWKWDFGDNSTSAQQNPKHTYARQGTYTVALTATNAEGSATKTQSGIISVQPPLLAAQFTATTALSGKVPLTVQFRDQSTGNPVGWNWDFGDNTTSTNSSPSHEYIKPGSYTVKLTVRNAQGATNTKEANEYVTLQELPKCEYTGWVSEEEGNPFVQCKPGYAMRGIKCRGKYCDSISLLCCPYIDGIDRTAVPEPVTNAWFSEEQPQGVTSNRQWVYAVRCRDDYCDGLNLRFFTTRYLQNTGVCGFIPQVSEEQTDGAKCSDNAFVCGMKCSGDYCDDISLYCCGVK